MNRELIAEARAALTAGPTDLIKVHDRLKRAGSSWSAAQHHLFFLAHPAFSVTGDQVTIESRGGSGDDHLLSEIIKIVEASGQPLPPREIRNRLPSGMTTTDEQVKALAKKSPALEVFGPGLIRPGR